jgi:hypothetical protein
MKRLLILLTLLTLMTLPALAQTPEPTVQVAPSYEAPAPTPEAVPMPDAPIVPAIPPALYATVINRLVDFILLLVGFGGGYMLIKAWKNPEQGKQYISFGLAMLEFAAKLTPTAADDAAIKRLVDALTPIIAPTVENTVKAVIAEERAKLAVQTGNKVEALSFVPQPDVKA